MAEPFGFSVGDLINAMALIDVAINVIRKRSELSGQCYEQLISELDSLKQVLQRLEVLEYSHPYEAQAKAIRGVALACIPPIWDFVDRVKYYDNLAAPSSISPGFHQLRRKMSFEASFEHDVQKLRAVITAKIISIDLLLSVLSFNCSPTSTKAFQHTPNKGGIDTEAIAGSQAVAHDILDYTSTPDEHGTGHKDNSLTKGSGAILLRLFKQIQAPLSKYSPETRLVIGKILQSNWHIYQVLLQIQHDIPKQPSLLSSSTLKFEDAFGRQLQLPYEYFHRWEVFEGFLRAHFKATPGEELVRNRQFRVLTRSASGEGLVDLDHWGQSVHEGSKLLMAMTFPRLRFDIAKCPRCFSNGSTNKDSGWSILTCNNCLLNFFAVQSAAFVLESRESTKGDSKKIPEAKTADIVSTTQQDDALLLDTPTLEQPQLPPNELPQPDLLECIAAVEWYANARRKGHIQDADQENFRTPEQDHDSDFLDSLLDMSSVPSLAESSASSVTDYEDPEFDSLPEKIGDSNDESDDHRDIGSFRNVNIELGHQYPPNPRVKWQIMRLQPAQTEERDLSPLSNTSTVEEKQSVHIQTQDLFPFEVRDKQPEADASRKSSALDHHLHLRFTSLDVGEPLGTVDKLKTFAESFSGKPIVWWPLKPSRLGPMPGLTKVSWKSGCGHEISAVMPNGSALDYRENISLSPGNPTSPILPFVQPPTSTSNSAEGSPSMTWPRKFPKLPYIRSSKANSTNKAQPQPQPTGNFHRLYLYWCVDTLLFRTASDYIVVLKDVTRDNHLINDLRSKYRALRGWRWWISLMTCSGIRFVEFGRIQADGPHVKCLKPGIPDPKDIEYEYELCAPNESAHTQILEATILHSFHEGCCISSTDIVRGMPKRKKLLESKYGMTAFGLHAQQGLSFSKFLVVFSGGLAGPFAFAIWYLTWNPWDLQNAFSLVFLMLGIISVLVLLPDLKIP